MGVAQNATAFNVDVGGNTDLFSFNLDQMPQTVLSVNEFMMSLARFGDKVSEIIEDGHVRL